MAFIGNQPTAVPLTSSQLADGLITTAKLASTAVTNPKVDAAAITTDKLNLISTASVPAVTAKGTPSVSDGYIQLNCEQNSHGIKLKSPPHSAAQSYTLTFPSTAPTNGTFLQTNSSGVLSFASAGATAGQVIQVLGATDSTQRTTTSLSFVTGSNTLSVTITPSASANKILILVSTTSEAGNDTAPFTIFRDSTNLGTAGGLTQTAPDRSLYPMSMLFLDSPSTTSAITYQVYMKCTGSGSGSAFLQTGSGTKPTGSIVCMEIKG